MYSCPDERRRSDKRRVFRSEWMLVTSISENRVGLGRSCSQSASRPGKQMYFGPGVGQLPSDVYAGSGPIEKLART